MRISILFFPTIVLGTINGLLSPIAQGCHSIVESQTFDLQKYKEQRDKLEYEALMRNPETAYLVSNEEFDRKRIGTPLYFYPVILIFYPVILHFYPVILIIATSQHK